MLAMWSVLEVCRTLCIALTLGMAIFNMAGSIVRKISKIKQLEDGIQMYSRFQVLTEIGREGIRQTAGILMATGFFIIITANFLVIRGPQYFPLPLILFFTAADICAVLSTSQTLPLIVNCYETSTDLIRRIWIHKLMAYRAISSAYKHRIMRKVLQAQRPVTHYYGAAMFDHDTKCNFYWNILCFTINLLLI